MVINQILKRQMRDLHLKRYALLILVIAFFLFAGCETVGSGSVVTIKSTVEQKEKLDLEFTAQKGVYPTTIQTIKCVITNHSDKQAFFNPNCILQIKSNKGWERVIQGPVSELDYLGIVEPHSENEVTFFSQKQLDTGMYRITTQASYDDLLQKEVVNLYTEFEIK